MTTVTAIVLAGGQSARMGQDKALILVKGQPLLHRVCAIAQQCTDSVYVITSWVERYQSIVPDGCKFIRELPPPNASQPQGPLVGFMQALTQIEADWVLLLACDLPHLTADPFKSWIQQLEQVPEQAIALLPHSPKGWEPLCGFYRHQCLSNLQTFVDNGGRSFQRWLDQNPVQELMGVDPSMLFNCNTPEDLNRI